MGDPNVCMQKDGWGKWKRREWWCGKVEHLKSCGVGYDRE